MHFRRKFPDAASASERDRWRSGKHRFPLSAQKPPGRLCVANLYSAQKDQDEHDHQDQSYPAGRIIAPATAIRPSGQRSQKYQNQNDEKDCSKRHHRSPLLVTGGISTLHKPMPQGDCSWRSPAARVSSSLSTAEMNDLGATGVWMGKLP